MRGNVLIVENDVDLSGVIAGYLSNEGFDVRLVTSAEDGLALLDTWSCNLIILDISLPGMDGFEFLNSFTKTSDIPVIVTSARVSEEDQIIGLGIGADEYITKPFSPRVLTARVRAMFRRMNGRRLPPPPDKGATRQVYHFGPYTLDMDRQTLEKGNEPIELAVKEFTLLAFLAENDGKPASPETIYKKVWDRSADSPSANCLNTVPVHIQRLRRKIEETPSKPVWLVTSRGRGYKLKATRKG